MKFHLILFVGLALLLASCNAITLESISEQQVCKTDCKCPAINNYWDAVLLFDDEASGGTPVNSTVAPTAFGSALFELALIFNHSEATPAQIQNNTFEYGLRFAVFASANQTILAHIHLGKRCNSGPVVVPLFNSSNTTAGVPVNSTGLLAKGFITAANLTGPLVNHTIWALIEEIQAGNAYVNVHTVSYPEGEARGQIHFTQHASETVHDLINATRCSKSFNDFYKLFVIANNGSSANNTTSNSTSIVLPGNVTATLSDLTNSSFNFTIFFPPDNILSSVFESLGSNNVSAQNISAFLSAHIVQGFFTAADLHSGVLNLTTLAGSQIIVDGTLSGEPGETGTPILQSSLTSAVIINNVTSIIGENSVVATNGIVHSLNRPLVPLSFVSSNATSSNSTVIATKHRLARLMKYF